MPSFETPEIPREMAPPSGSPKIGEKMPEGPLWTPKEKEQEKKRRKDHPDWWRESQ